MYITCIYHAPERLGKNWQWKIFQVIYQYFYIALSRYEQGAVLLADRIASVQSGRSIASPACYLYFKHWLGQLINISPTPNGPGVSDLNYNADNCHTDGQLHVLELNRQYFFSLLKRLHMKWILKPISKYQA